MYKHVTSQFLDWRDGRADRTDIDRHLRECSSCRLYYERMTRLLDPAAADDLPRLVPDPYLPGRISALAAERGRTQSAETEGIRPLLMGAVCFTAVVVGILIGMTFRPEPPDEDLDEIVTLYRQAVSGDDFSNQLDLVLEESGGEPE